MKDRDPGKEATPSGHVRDFLESQVYSEVSAALTNYVDARQRLLDLGVIRSTRTVQADYGEWVAANVLGIELCASGVEPGFDATDADGRRYQVKTRLVQAADSSTSFDFKKPLPDFDIFVGVLLRMDYRPLALITADRKSVLGHCNENRGTFRLRWKKELMHSAWLACRRFE